MTTPARVLLVDDHPIVREGLRARIAQFSEYVVCGEAADSEAALAQAQALHPDLAIVDLSLGKESGLDLIRRMKRAHPRLTVLVLSMHDESIYAERCIQAGASGYVSKDAPAETLLEAMRSTLDGHIHLSPEQLDRVVARALGGKVSDAKSPLQSLTAREFEVLNLIGEGLSTRELAEALHLSVHTVDTYRDKLKTKLGLASGAELTRYAITLYLGRQ